MTDVVDGIHDKLVRRHPHVFGSVDADDADTVVANWDAIKHAEKGRTSVFDGVAMSQPSLSYAYHVQRKAAKVGFDWPDVDGALPKIAEEAAELERGDRQPVTVIASTTSSATCCSRSSTSPVISTSSRRPPCASRHTSSVVGSNRSSGSPRERGIVMSSADLAVARRACGTKSSRDE